MKTKAFSWLLNPFIYVAGWTSLGLGLFIMLLTALLGNFSNTHLEGVVGVGVGVSAPFHIFILQALLAWLSISLMLFIAGKITSRASFRLVDLAGTQALARAPMLLAVLISFPESNRRVTKYLLGKFLGHGEEVSVSQVDFVFYVMAILLTTLIVIWTIVLMYNAYKVCCNLRGAKAGISFSIALIVAHFLSLAIYMVYFSNSQFELQEYLGN